MFETTGAPSQGNQAESPPAPEAEQIKPAGQEQASEDQSTEEQGAEGAEPRDDGKRKRGLGERALEYRNQARDLARVNERLLNLMEQSLLGKAPHVEQPSGPPQREDFDNYEAYLEAKADFQVAEKFKEVEARADKARQETELRDREATWQKLEQKAAKKYEDYEDVVLSDDLAITPIMAAAIKDAREIGPDIAYFLGKNPDEASRIAKLQPAAQVREIGKIEARLESKAEPAKRQSKAPPPIEPIGGGSSSTDPSSMSQKEYEAYRAKQGAWWAKR
jgi:hypothetical protein